MPTATAWRTYWQQFAWDTPTHSDVHALITDLAACEAEVARLRALLAHATLQEEAPHAPR
jgi:hypothetical protein